MLERIAVPGTGRETTRVGFGGSGLMGGVSERESLLLLETAFDAGIRHFDVAPSYGYGKAERCLGKFLRGKAEQITVATKYGILPPARAGLLGVARGMVGPAVRRLPAVRRRVVQAAAGLKTKAKFCAEEARRSLEHSLRELSVDRIDMWLLHEVTAEDLDQSDLLAFLEQMRREGRIGAYGVGTERAKLEAVWSRHHDYCPLLQFEWSVMDERAEFPGAYVIHHRAISGALGRIRDLFEGDTELRRRWSKAVDADLAKPETLAAVLLQAALVSNCDGMVLFSSRVPGHIRGNIRALEDPGSGARGRRFLTLVAEERERMGEAGWK